MSNYDGRRVLDTPMSVEACKQEGVDPVNLVNVELLPQFVRKDDDPYSKIRPTTSDETAAKKAFMQRRRQAMLLQVLSRYEQLKKAGWKPQPVVAAPPSPRAAAEVVAADADSSVPLPKPPARPSGVTAADGSQSPLKRNRFGNLVVSQSADEEDVVAQYFLSLKKDADKYVERVAKWTEKESLLASKTETVERLRQEKANALHEKVLNSTMKASQMHQKLEVERMQKAAEKVEKVHAAIEEHHAATLKRTLSPKKVDRGEAERQQAQKLLEEKADKIRARLVKAEQEAQAKVAAKQLALQLKEFESKLKEAAYKELCTRAETAREYKRSLLEGRSTNRLTAKASAREERERLQYEKTLLREALERQKLAVQEYVKSTTVEAAAVTTASGKVVPIFPPTWLATRVKREEQRAKTARSSSPLKLPPASPSRAVTAESADGSSSSPKRFVPVKPKFQGQPDTHDTQSRAFAKWMFLD